MGRFYGYKPLDEDQINQSAQLLAQGLGTGTTTPTYTWDAYEDWWLNALNDGKVTRAEWKDLSTKLGINRRATRKAFKRGGDTWNNYLNDVIKPKLIRNAYVYRDPTTGVVEVISQGDAKYNPTDYEAAYYKGTDPSKLVDAYNTALADARKNATITYKQGPDGKWGYYTSYRVGNYDINDLNVTDSDWFQNDTDRRTNAQLKAYKQAVDSYNKDEFKDYLNDDGTALLSKLTLDGGDAEKKAKLKKEAWDKLSDEDKKTLQKDVTSAIVKLYSDTANAGGSITWDNAVKAAARHKALMDYYNSKSIPWLDKLTWQDGSNYNKASNIKAVSSDDRTGNLIFRKGGFIRPRTLAKGGMIVKAGWGTTLFGNGVLGQGADLVTDFVPIAGFINRAADGSFQNQDGSIDWGKVALNAGLELLGPAAKGVKVLYRGYKAAKGANNALKVVKGLKTIDRLKGIKDLDREIKAYEKAITNMEKIDSGISVTKKVENLKTAITNLQKKVADNPALVSKLEPLNKDILETLSQLHNYKHISTGVFADIKNSLGAWKAGIKKTNQLNAAAHGGFSRGVGTLTGAGVKTGLATGAIRAIARNKDNFPGTVATTDESTTTANSTPAVPTNATGSLGDDTSLTESTPVVTNAQVAEALRQGILNRSPEVGAANY